jgi:hypothetical protein
VENPAICKLAIHSFHLILSSLLQEVTEKQDRITQLEKEKSLLVRELFEERAKRRPIEDASMM